ncbi:MAG: Ig-like domain-containing protein [Halobacteriota archaeon]|nr:Ig-like domain-containing protein [Halobacteriota archaeon]
MKKMKRINKKNGLILLISIFSLMCCIGTVSAVTITVDPGESIQDAIDSLPAEGGVIELGEGTWEISSSINIIQRNNTTIKGNGAGSTFIVTDEEDICLFVVSSLEDNDFIIHETEGGAAQQDPRLKNAPFYYNITIEDLTLVGPGIRVGDGDRIAGILYAKIADSKIENVDIIDFGHSILLYRSNENIIDGNSLVNSNKGALFFSVCDNNTVKNNVIDGADRWYGFDINGGGLYNEVFNNTIKNCGGGGLKIYSAAHHNEIYGNIFESNSKLGITIMDGHDNPIHNNIFVGNSAWEGEAIVIQKSGGLNTKHLNYNNTIYNNVFYENTGNVTTSTVGDCPKIYNNIIVKNNGIVSYGIDSYNLTYNDIWENTGGDVGGGFGTISIDPEFVDPENGDFHLRTSSPCIDAGDPLDDYSNEPEDNGDRINMGAYGNTIYASKSGSSPGDTTPPTITDNSPTGTDVSIGSDISVTFSEAMNITSTEDAFGISPSVSGSFGWNGNEMTFDPTSDLSNEQTYIVTIGTSAEDLAGNNLESEYSWNFTTEAAASSLVAEWKFDNGSGINAFDSSGNSNHGTITNATWTSDCIGGDYAMSFDGNTSVEVSDSSSLDSVNSNITIIAWIKTTSFEDHQNILEKWDFDGVNERSFELKIRDNRSIQFGISSDGTSVTWLDSDGLISNNTWMHIAATSDGETMKIYHNGQVDPNTKSAPSGGIYESSADLHIGRWWDGNDDWIWPFIGVMDEVKIYNRALSSSEILSDYENSINDLDPPTITDNSPTGTDVSIGSDISVTFSEAMNTTSAEDAFGISPSVSGSFGWNGNEMTFDPTSDLSNEQTYIVTIGTSAEDLAGNNLESEYSWNFTTEAAASSLVAEWKFDNGSGINAFDSSGNSNHGTITNATWTSDCIGGDYAMSFDGNTSVEVSDSSSLDSVNSNITIIAWIKTTSFEDHQNILEKWDFDGVNERSFELKIRDNRSIQFGISSDGTSVTWLDSDGLISNNTWMHIAATSDGETMKIYHNGQVDPNTKSAPSGGIYESSADLHIGRWWDGNDDWIWPFIGVMDEVKIYNRALSSSEILSDYENSINDLDPPTITDNSPTGTDVSIGSDISVTFSEAMNTTSAEDAFGISPSVSGSFGWNGNEMTFDPTSDLSNEQTYTVTMGTGAEDLAGNNLESEYSWNFTTEAADMPPSSITNLVNTTYEQTYINWTWDNPSDPDFDYVMVYVDDVWKVNTSDEYYNATGLTAGTSHTIGTHTVDENGNINTTWVNHTATTKEASGPITTTYDATDGRSYFKAYGTYSDWWYDLIEEGGTEATLPSECNIEVDDVSGMSDAYTRLSYSDATGGDSDSNRYINPDEGLGDESTFIVHIWIDEDVEDIDEVSFEWEGYGDGAHLLRLYVFDYVEGDWDGGSSGYKDYGSGNSDFTLEWSTTSGISNYVNGDNQLAFLILDTTSSEDSFHDYVKLDVTST